MDNLNDAIRSWQDTLGQEYVITQEAALNAAQTATFVTTAEIPAILLRLIP